MVDTAICRRCSLAALAKVLDQFGGINLFSGIAVGLHLQKFWIISAESTGRQLWNGVLGAPVALSGLWNGVLGIQWRQVRSGMALWEA